MAKCAVCESEALQGKYLCGECSGVNANIEEKRLNVRMSLQAVEGARSGPDYKFHGGEGGMTDMRLKTLECAVHALFELVEALEAK